MTNADGTEQEVRQDETRQEASSYPEGKHLRLVTWQEIMDWKTPYDTLAAEMENVGDGETAPGEPCFLYGEVEKKLQERLGDEHWELDSQGRAGIIVKADEGYRFTGRLTLVDERTEEVVGGKIEEGDGEQVGGLNPGEGK